MKFLAALWAPFVTKRYINVQKRGVRIPVRNSSFGAVAHFTPKHVDEANLNSYSVANTVLHKYELVAVTETGQFKVGDGVTPFKDLPWADRLPVLTYMERQEIK